MSLFHLTPGLVKNQFWSVLSLLLHSVRAEVLKSNLLIQVKC